MPHKRDGKLKFGCRSTGCDGIKLPVPQFGLTHPKISNLPGLNCIMFGNKLASLLLWALQYVVYTPIIEMCIFFGLIK